MSLVTTNDSDPCESTLVGSLASMRFNVVVGNLGAPLRDPLDEFAVNDCGNDRDVDVDLS